MPQTTILGEELAYIDAARLHAPPPERGGADSVQAVGAASDPPPLPFADDETRELAATKQLCALAFSGGGIRSATFNLGVLQALAELGLLAKIDYLSTVSGGGYIGAWLTAWIHRTAKDANGAAPAESPLQRVQGKLRASISAAEHTIRFLREHSNYLTPRTGLLGADTWSAVSIYLRNLTLNLAILMGVLFAALLIPRPLLAFFEWVASRPVPELVQRVAGALPSWAAEVLLRSSPADWLAFAVLLPAVVMAGFSLRFLHGAGDEHTLTYKLSRQGSVLALIVAPTVVATFLIASSMWKDPQAGGAAGTDVGWIPYVVGVSGWWVGLWLILVMFWHINAMPVASHSGAKAEPQSGPILGGGALISAVASGILAAVLLRLIDQSDVSKVDGAVWMTLGVPTAIGIISLSAVVNLGLMGRLVSEEVREWWSRLGGWLLIVAVVWMGLCGIAFFAPQLTRSVKIPAAGAWLITTLFGVLGGRSPKTSGSDENRLAEFGVSIAPYVFVIGLLLALSIFADWFVGTAFPATDVVNGCNPAHLNCQWWHAPMMIGACLAGAWILSWRVDINAFSLQPLYRNRLVRCYLGASHAPRIPHPFTGFDPKDDIGLAHLSRGSSALRPYPLINVALNLVKSKDLALQERKAASFTMAPLHCGFYKYYRRTEEYAAGSLTLGEAVATSGAAASPNMGYHSNPALSFLMTIFNVRLGMWLANPRRRGWRGAGPGVGLFALLSELFGNTSDEAKYVYLSDGGHFDNLGIYELLRRRCRFIIACDASADPHVRFDDLGGVIRKCRTDFGLDITLDTTSLQLDPHSGRSSFHCAVAQIRYPEGSNATLLYLKASLTGSETVDVLNYAAADKSFPHQSTADQWFSESQFESYRRLGYHCAHTVFAGVVRDEKALTSLEGIFTALRERWYPPTGVAEGTFSRHAAQLDALNERIRANPRLAFLDPQIVPSWPELMRGTSPASDAANGNGKEGGANDGRQASLWLPSDPAARRDGFYVCASVLQLMENVYADLGLETHCDHPDNRGWMNLFRHWSWCSMLRVTWALTAATYGARFQTFCRERLDLDIGTVTVEPTTFAELNFVEQEIARSFGQRMNGDTTFPDVQLYAVKLRVVHPDMRRNRNGGAKAIDFAVGFAAVKGGNLLYLRIQDHLRKMGLARQALRDLLIQRVIRGLATGVSAPSSEYEEVFDEAGLKRLFESVKTDFVSAPSGVAKATAPAAGHSTISVVQAE